MIFTNHARANAGALTNQYRNLSIEDNRPIPNAIVASNKPVSASSIIFRLISSSPATATKNPFTDNIMIVSKIETGMATDIDSPIA